MRVYKYPLELDADGHARALMPRVARILAVQAQREQPCIWALVSPEAAPTLRTFLIAGTGHELPTTLDMNAPYIGTFQLHGGDLVFHVFEVT